MPVKRAAGKKVKTALFQVELILVRADTLYKCGWFVPLSSAELLQKAMEKERERERRRDNVPQFWADRRGFLKDTRCEKQIPESVQGTLDVSICSWKAFSR